MRFGALLKFRQIQKDYVGWIANRRKVARKIEATGGAVHTENGHVIGSLIAGVKELSGGIEIKTARVVPACRFVLDKREFTVSTNGKHRDAVVYAIAGVDKPAVLGNKDLRAKITARVSGRQTRKGLPGCELSGGGIKIELS